MTQKEIFVQHPPKKCQRPWPREMSIQSENQSKSFKSLTRRKVKDLINLLPPSSREHCNVAYLLLGNVNKAKMCIQALVTTSAAWFARCWTRVWLRPIASAHSLKVRDRPSASPNRNLINRASRLSKLRAKAATTSACNWVRSAKSTSAIKALSWCRLLSFFSVSVPPREWVWYLVFVV
jgi:hypothetical protein